MTLRSSSICLQISINGEIMPIPSTPRDFGDGLKPIRLTDKQYMFVEIYLSCFNATEACRGAGYKGNDRSLASMGWENLRKPNVKEAIRRRLSAQAMSTEEALKRVAEIARGNMAQFIKVDPNTQKKILDLSAVLDEGQGGIIKSMDVMPDGEIKNVELYPKDKALDMILRAAQAYSDGVVVNLPPWDPAEWARLQQERLDAIEKLQDPYTPEEPHEAN